MAAAQGPKSLVKGAGSGYARPDQDYRSEDHDKRHGRGQCCEKGEQEEGCSEDRTYDGIEGLDVSEKANMAWRVFEAFRHHTQVTGGR